MKSIELRKKFFDFFKKNEHTIVASSSLIPADDPTLLFTNAGMNQFKDVFLGKEKRPYNRATSIQKCMRAGGKHNDLENVGITKRHLTFFEMMGNFSFGDYFKKEAIRFAWDFVTKEIGLNQDVLYATVFEKDDESYNIWRDEIGLPESQIYRLSAHDNFWQMGDTGPCGPCSEIYIDRGLKYGCGKSNCGPGCECERYLEFWNLVFMEFDRQEDGQDLPLKYKGVDTGMGLERLAVIMQKVDSVFETDLFIPLYQAIEKLTDITYKEATQSQQVAFRVLSDHIRSSAFAIADGALPSNEGRGYVIRKIIRRAALFSQRLTDKNIFPDLADTLINQMKDIYPELFTAKKLIKKLLTQEIEKFSSNLLSGQVRLKKYLQETENQKIITGQQAFKLYDTFGFPLELTLDIAKEYGYSVDIQGFEKEMEQQRIKSGKKIDDTKTIKLSPEITTHFIGYKNLETSGVIIALIMNNQLVNSVPSGSDCWVITDTSPFFVEKGGQVSDQGILQFDEHKVPLKKLKWIDKAIAINITTPKEINVGDTVTQTVDQNTRLDTMKNHTATHLLQSALIKILGPQVRQSGSLVDPDYLRFDFTYTQNLTSEQIATVEKLVNAKIMENIPTNIFETSYEDAMNKGAIAIFDEKYNPEKVRVIDIPGFSAELCGGTHVQATGEIGCFKITEVSALSAGNRRIFAITGPKALELFQENFNTIKKLTQIFKVQSKEILPTIEKQKEQLKAAQSHIKKLKKEIVTSQIPTWLDQVTEINNIPYLFLLLQDAQADEIKELALELNTQKPGFYFIGSNSGDRSNFFCFTSKKFSDKLDLKNLASILKEKASLRGGGNKTQLQGGGPKITLELNTDIKNWIES